MLILVQDPIVSLYKIPIKPDLNGPLGYLRLRAAKDLMSQDLKNSVAAWYAVCFNLARSARCLRKYFGKTAMIDGPMECQLGRKNEGRDIPNQSIQGDF